MKKKIKKSKEFLHFFSLHKECFIILIWFIRFLQPEKQEEQDPLCRNKTLNLLLSQDKMRVLPSWFCSLEQAQSLQFLFQKILHFCLKELQFLKLLLQFASHGLWYSILVDWCWVVNRAQNHFFFNYLMRSVGSWSFFPIKEREREKLSDNKQKQNKAFCVENH